MTIPDKSQKAFVSVVEMSEMLDLSKSRFYALIQAGIFPKPALHQSCKRPVFDSNLQHKCLDIRRTGIGYNGQPVLFNRKRRKSQPKPRHDRQPVAEEHREVVEAVRGLGLTTTSQDVQAALREVYPTGTSGLDEGEVIRKIFLHLRAKR